MIDYVIIFSYCIINFLILILLSNNIGHHYHTTQISDETQSFLFIFLNIWHP